MYWVKACYFPWFVPNLLPDNYSGDPEFQDYESEREIKPRIHNMTKTQAILVCGSTQVMEEFL